MKTDLIPTWRPLLSALLASMAFTMTARAATIIWTNTAGGNWNVAANWNPQQVPGAADDPCITNNSSYTVTVNTPVNVASLTLGGATGTQTLNLSANTFTLTGPGNGNNQAVLSITGGTLAGPGTLTLAGIH